MRDITVFVDLLFMLNLGMNCWVLWATGVLLQRPTKMAPMFLAAASGSVFAFMWLLIPLKLFPELILKMVVAAAMVQLCFAPGKVRELAKLTGVYLGISALCAGITYAMALSGTAKTGEPLPPVAWWLVLGGPVVMTLPLKKVWAYLIARISSLENSAQLRFTLCGTAFEVSAALDTGNTLQEPFTARPVIIVNPKVLLNVFSEQCVQLMVTWQGGRHDLLLDELIDTDLITKLIFIPYTTVSESGLMLGIRPDKCEIYRHAGWHEVKAVLGLGREDVELAGYGALMPVSFLSVELEEAFR